MYNDLKKEIEVIKNDIESLNEIIRDLMDKIEEVLSPSNIVEVIEGGGAFLPPVGTKGIVLCKSKDGIDTTIRDFNGKIWHVPTFAVREVLK